MNLTQFLLVFAGGGIGAALRCALSTAAVRAFGTALPVGTFGINLLGCLLMGLAAECAARSFGFSDNLRLFLMTGVLGGFTTFSTFALEALSLGARGAVGAAVIYAAASAGLGILCCALGMGAARLIA